MNDSMPLQQVKPNIKKCLFLLLWIGINVGSWAITDTIFTFIPSSGVLSYIALFAMAGVMGSLQWYLLKRQFLITWHEWTIFTIVGFAFGFYGFIWIALRDYYIVFSPPGSPVLEWDPLLGGALLGLVLGCCQSTVWRPRFDHILIWVVVNVLGWSLGMFLPQLIAFLLHDVNPPWLSTHFPIAFAAVVTGIALLWFLGDQRELAKRT